MRLPFLVTILLLAAHPAASCVTQLERSYEIFRRADIVIRAKVVRYEARPLSQDAVFEFETIDALTSKGASRGRWRARWQNSTYGEPERWPGSKVVIVGLRQGRDRDLEVVQQDCGPVSILEDTPANLERVRQARQ
jgi:hypothetical protein